MASLSNPGNGEKPVSPLLAFLKHPLRKYCEKNEPYAPQMLSVRAYQPVSLFAPFPVVYADSIETGYSPEGTALQLVLKTINSAQQEIRLMGYSFTSPEVAGALVRAKRRGVDVKVVLDWKANTGKQNQASLAAMNLLVNAGIPVRTVSQYKIMHDKVIIADGRNIEVGSFNYTRSADRVNSENVLVVWDVPVVAQRYLQHWSTRWSQGTDWKRALLTHLSHKTSINTVHLRPC
jgi:phosphatidylserine/phosphatidylglycerophosphate/cardiolipin synthase-like enzyme